MLRHRLPPDAQPSDPRGTTAANLHNRTVDNESVVYIFWSMTTQPAPTIRKFNPGLFQSNQEIRKQFVVRGHELGLLLDDLRGNIKIPLVPAHSSARAARTGQDHAPCADRGGAA